MADRRGLEIESVPSAMVWIGRLALTDFRCYARAELIADGRFSARAATRDVRGVERVEGRFAVGADLIATAAWLRAG